MAARLGVLAVVMLFALAMLTDMRHPFLDADEMSRMVAVLFCVVFIARMVAPYANGALVSFAAMLFTSIVTCLVVVEAFLHLRPRDPGTQILLAYVVSMLAGGVAGHFVFDVLNFLLRKLKASQANTAALADDTAGDREDPLRRLVSRIFHGLGSLFHALRLLLAGYVVAFLVPLAYDLARAARAGGVTMQREYDFYLSMAIAGAMGGCVLLPLGRIKALAATAIALLVCVHAGIACVLPTHGIAGFSRAASVASPTIFIGSGIALLACLIAHFLASHALRALRAWLAKQYETGANDATEECCERCGYLLHGSPSKRCESCGIDMVRCPECGHRQPSGVLHALTLDRLHKCHLAIRISAWLMTALVAFLTLGPWFAIGVGGLYLRRFDFQEFVLFNVSAAILIAPLRLLLMRFRPLHVVSLAISVIPLLVVFAGTSIRYTDSRLVPMVIIYFAPGWLIGAFLAPMLWRCWLRLMYGPAGEAVYGWHISKPYRRPAAGGVEYVIAREWPMTCSGCGTAAADGVTHRCEACQVLEMRCSSCSANMPIPEVRMGMETLITRARLALLALIGGASAPILVILWLMFLGFTSNIRYEQWPPYALAFAMGVWVRLSLVRRKFPFALAWVVAAILAGALIVPALLFTDWLTPGYWRHCAGLLATGVLGAFSAVPLLQLLARATLPQANAAALVDFLRGRATLDESAGKLNAQ